MKPTKIFFVFLLSLLITSVITAKDEEQKPKQYVGSTAFEMLKKMIGSWEGTASMHKEGEKVKVKYRLTAAGSAIIEDLMPGTPHEMVSVYHDQKGKLVMTHYCMIGNQPKMELKSVEDKSIALSFVETSGINVSADQHMHSLKITFKDDNNMVQTWTFFEEGKEKGVNTLILSRSE